MKKHLSIGLLFLVLSSIIFLLYFFIESTYGLLMNTFGHDKKVITIDTSDYRNPSFTDPDKYSLVDGVVCFRGNNFRNTASFGTASIKEKTLSTVWSYHISALDSWSGVGWNGQPALIRWDDSVKKIMNIVPQKKEKDGLTEVIYAALDGKVYFLDIDDGVQTRSAIQLPGPIKGSVSIDPRGFPLLYVGQGIPVVKNKPVPIGYRIFNLIDQTQLFFINGKDPYALRNWFAFDSTSLLDIKRDILYEAGENGVFYKIKMNTAFSPEEASIKINPKIEKYRYTFKNSKKRGIENSTAIYKNLAFFADNDGILQCLNLDTLKTVWTADVTDDTDSTIVIEKDDKNVYLYTACEVDKQGASGNSYIRKFNALTGDLVWENSYPCRYSSNVNGGVLATPVLGKNNISHLIIYNVEKTGTGSAGKLIAFDKQTGQTVWEKNLKSYCWSSPVAVYTPEGKAYLIQCDSVGTMFLIDPETGETLDSLSLGANVEGSPAVFDNMIVVGTRGRVIWGVRIN